MNPGSLSLINCCCLYKQTRPPHGAVVFRNDKRRRPLSLRNKVAHSETITGSNMALSANFARSRLRPVVRGRTRPLKTVVFG